MSDSASRAYNVLRLGEGISNDKSGSQVSYGFHSGAPDRSSGSCNAGPRDFLLIHRHISSRASRRSCNPPPAPPGEMRLLRGCNSVHRARIVMRSFSKCTDAWVLITARGAGAYRGRHDGIFCPPPGRSSILPTCRYGRRSRFAAFFCTPSLVLILKF